MAKLVLIPAVVMWVFWLLGQDKGIPVILILLAVVVLVYNYFTSNTVPGRYLYAMGGNEKAARLSGVNTKRIQFFAYTNMGFLASVAALVCVSRFNSAAPSAGTNYEMDAIAACYIGWRLRLWRRGQGGRRCHRRHLHGRSEQWYVDFEALTKTGSAR